jgi:DNA-binding PadR family transcriptional regulator
MSALARAGHVEPPRVAAARPSDPCVTAWLLLLLDAGVGHGYELRRELVARGVPVELPVLYRKLRKLERDGWTVSRWTSSVSGPRRRSYELTCGGRRVLDEAAVVIATLRDQHEAFLHAHTLAGRATDRQEEP